MSLSQQLVCLYPVLSVDDAKSGPVNDNRRQSFMILAEHLDVLCVAGIPSW